MHAEITDTLAGVSVFTDTGDPLHLFTVDDFERMIAAGVFDDMEGDIELLEGVLIEMSREGPAHGHVVRLLAEWAIHGAGLGGPLLVAVGNPVKLPPRSQPAPDLAVIDRSSSNTEEHPGWAHLAIEVAHASLRKDLVRKARIYAAARIPEYWVIDLNHRLVHVHREPEGYAYLSIERYETPVTLAPEAVDLPPLDLGALLSTGPQG